MEKLQKFIDKHGVKAKLIEKSSTQETLKAHEALQELGYQIQPGQMIKALVCVPIENGSYAKNKAVLAMVSANDRLNLKALAELLGFGRIMVADQKTAETLSGYPRGGTPPIGHDNKMAVVSDDELFSQPILYGGGGDTNHVIEITPQEIKRIIEDVEKSKFIVTKICG